MKNLAYFSDPPIKPIEGEGEEWNENTEQGI